MELADFVRLNSYSEGLLPANGTIPLLAGVMRIVHVFVKLPPIANEHRVEDNDLYKCYRLQYRLAVDEVQTCQLYTVQRLTDIRIQNQVHADMNHQ